MISRSYFAFATTNLDWKSRNEIPMENAESISSKAKSVSFAKADGPKSEHDEKKKPKSKAVDSWPVDFMNHVPAGHCVGAQPAR